MTSESPDPGEQRGDQTRSELKKIDLVELFARLSSTPLAFEDERLAPDVDRDVLVSLVRGELPEDEARVIYRLVYSFKSWCDAHTEVLAEQSRRRRT
jgi:hypothetical protein